MDHKIEPQAKFRFLPTDQLVETGKEPICDFCNATITDWHDWGQNDP